MSKHPQVLTWAKEYKEACGIEPPTNSTSKSRMPLAEALASTKRPTLPPLPAAPAGVDRVEDYSETSNSGSSGYFSSLRSSYNKLRITTNELAAPPSLPSLKSSGLLESWVNQPQPPSQQLPDGGVSEHPTSPTPPWMALRMSNIPKEPAAGPSESTPSPSPRCPKSTMPVGLDWLANEL
jgi:hypothetical protein